MERARRSAVRQRLVEEIYIPRDGVKLVVERETLQKMAIRTETGLEFNISKVTNFKQKACNLVSVKVVNYPIQSFLFPQNLKFFNTFLVFMISLSDPIFFRSGDPRLIPTNTLPKLPRR